MKKIIALLILTYIATINRSANAGQWSIYYECHGLTSVEGILASPDIYTSQWSSVTSNEGTGQGFASSVSSVTQCLPHASTIGTIKATLTWIPSYTGETPQKNYITILEHSVATAGCRGRATSGNTNNGFNDPQTIFSIGDHKSEGYHLIRLPINHNNGTWTISVPTRKMSASYYLLDPTPIAHFPNQELAYINYQVTIANQSLGAHSTIDTVGWDVSNPFFFSGTACTASGTAVPIEQGATITKAQLCISENGNDISVKEYPRDFAGDTNQYISLPLSCRFDSSHFVNGSIIHIKLKVWDSSNNYAEGEICAPARNRVYGIANQTLIFWGWHFANDILSSAMSKASAINYEVTPRLYDNKLTMLGMIPYYSIFFANTHGQSGGSISDCIGDDGNNETDAAGDMLHWTIPWEDIAYHHGIADAVALKSNNNHIPPYLFVQANACQAGTSDALGKAFDVLNHNDTGFLGWQKYIDMKHAFKEWDDRFWDYLSQGYDLEPAAVYAGAALGSDSGLPYDVKAIFPTIYGDKSSKIHGVYGTTGIPKGQGVPWYIGL